MSNKNISEVVLRGAMKARVPAMLVGAPGTSKTAMVNAIAEEMGYEVISVILSRMEPTDISGFPTKGVSTEGNSAHPMTEYAPQEWQLQVMKKKKVIIFFDEFSNAHPSVKASCLTVIQDRQFPNGDWFPDETILVGAMNPTDSAADGYGMDKATSNRITFIPWQPTIDSWLEGMPDNWGRGVESEGERKWRNLIVRFIKDNPGSLHQENDSNDVGNTESFGINQADSSEMTVLEAAWASRRSWDNLSRILGSMTDDGVTESIFEDAAMAGTVGYSVSHRFRDWLRKNSQLDVKKIVASPRDFDGWENIVPDDANLILRSAIEMANAKNIEKIYDIFRIFHEVDRASLAAAHIPDMVALNNKVGKGLSDKKKKEITTDAKSILTLYQNVFQNLRGGKKAATAAAAN